MTTFITGGAGFIGSNFAHYISDIWNDPMNVAIRKNIFLSKFDLEICKNCLMD